LSEQVNKNENTSISAGSELMASIVIPAKNAGDSIHRCLNALTQQTLSSTDYEVILIDDGSVDNTADIAESFEIRVVRADHGGPALARNNGAKLAKAPVILFTDADCIPEKDWVEKMLEPFSNPDVAGVKGAYRSNQRELIARFVQAEYESKYEYMSRFEFIDFIDTYSAGFRRDIFLELKGFDTRFPGASVEDQEFSFRLHEKGHRMVFVPEAVVQHRHADNALWYFRKKFRIGFWKVLVLKRHPGKTVRDTHTPQTLKLQLPVAFIFLASLLLVPFGFWQPSVLLFCIFMGLGFRETIHCLKSAGPGLALASPLVMLIRSLALGSGLLVGLVKL